MALWKDKTRKHWRYDFQYQGSRYTGRGYATRREAETAMSERKKTLKETPTKTGMAFSESCNQYLDFAQKRFAEETYKYKVYVYTKFFEFLGKDFQLQEITPSIIASYLKTRHSNNNYNVHRRELSALFTYAKDTLETIEKNPVKKVGRLPHTPAVKQIPKEEDVIKLLLAADPQTDENDLLIVLLHTLARIDEVLRLTWEDINFENRTLTKWTRKTKDGAYRPVTVTMNDELYNTLWSMWQKKLQNTWVFYNKRTEDRYYKRPKFMKGLCSRAGISPHFGFHTLRHLMASLMADNPKISTKTIQKILGHASHRTTEIYLHELDGAIGSAMESISGKFTQRKEDPRPQAPPTNYKGSQQNN